VAEPWTALVPARFGEGSKTRLASALSLPDRLALMNSMARHVLATLALCPRITRIVLLSPARPDWWQGDWALDRGHGLNAELTAWRATHIGPLCIINADLPMLTVDDVTALIEVAAVHGATMAVDHVGTGTNAVALQRDWPFAFRFGVNSHAQHAAQMPVGAVLSRPGLSRDIDVPDDLEWVARDDFAHIDAHHPTPSCAS
jgi:2-phospho-L-lactate/phosphoenolpyruvate guanylyltransferase